MGGSSASTPRDTKKVETTVPVEVPPQHGEGQPSAETPNLAKPVDPEPRPIYDLRDYSGWDGHAWNNDIQQEFETGEESLDDARWVNVETRPNNHLYAKPFSRFLTRLLHHDQRAPIGTDGGLSYACPKKACRSGYNQGSTMI